MTPFTDEDLIEFTHKYGHLTHCISLIARLEAAEKIVMLGQTRLNEQFVAAAIIAWRKAAGK